MKIIIFGSGSAFTGYVERYKGYFENIEILALTDNNKSKHGQFCLGKQIIAPQEITQYSYDIILICSSYQEEIYEQLVSEFNVSNEKIYTRTAFLEEMIFPWYDKKYDLYNKNLLIIMAVNGEVQEYRKYWDKYYHMFHVIGTIALDDISSMSEYPYDFFWFGDLPYVSQEKKDKTINNFLKDEMGGKEKRLTDDVMNAYSDCMREVQFGEDYPDKKFLLIRPAEYYEGLGWIALNVARGVAYAKKKGYIPVVDMKTQKTQYLEREEYGIINAYTKFFRQPTEYDLEDIASARTVWLKYGSMMWMSKKELNELHMPKMQLELDEKCKEFKKCFHHKKVLGVLFRGTDYANLKPYGHSVQPDLAMMIETVKQKILDWGGFDLIYLCTEVQQACEQFIDEFGREKVCFYPQLRYESDTKKLLANVSLNEENGHTIQGKGYWIALNCLAACDSLVAGKCAGTMVALAINNHQYRHEYLFELGKYGADDNILRMLG